MARLPDLGSMEAIPPALRYRLRDAIGHIARARTSDDELDGLAAERLDRVLADGAPWFGADPSLAAVGVWMIDAAHGVALRRRGCAWLAMFPTVDTVKRLARLVADPATPAPVREQATCTLGDRELRARHPSTQWATDAVQLADEALARLADAATAAGRVTSECLPRALRHVQSDMTSAIFAKAPGLWGDALEAFATPPLARVLFVSIGDLPAQHRIRTLRLIGATLGEEAVPLMASRAADVAIEERLEMLFLAVTFGGEAYLPRLEAALAGMRHVDHLRKRARWHLQHPRVVPTVRGLRVARTTACLLPSERALRCKQAADDLGALAQFARHPETDLHELWAWMVRGAGDPARARELVAQHPASQALVRDLHLEDLARRGRVTQLVAAAQMLGCAGLGALQLAIFGRPLAALELAATVRGSSPELVVARALGCFRAGRADLAVRVLAEEAPPTEIVDDEVLPAFPGPHERWLVAHAASPIIAGLAKGLEGVLSLAEPAPLDAEPDHASVAGVAAVARRLDRSLAGATVYLAGDFAKLDKAALIAAIEKVGARVASGPAPGTDFYVQGESCAVHTLAQLERQGARRLRRDELEQV